MYHQPAFLDDMERLAVEAGRAILEIYRTDFSVDHKADKSPFTLADTRSHRIIADGLQAGYPDIPVLSEEGKSVPYGERKDWDRYWLVDPLDGTKEFIKRNDDFTVNIALICDQMPTMGVVYVPALDDLYLADVQKGCYRIFRGCKTQLKIPPKMPVSPFRRTGGLYRAASCQGKHSTGKLSEILHGCIRRGGFISATRSDLGMGYGSRSRRGACRWWRGGGSRGKPYPLQQGNAFKRAVSGGAQPGVSSENPCDIGLFDLVLVKPKAV